MVFKYKGEHLMSNSINVFNIYKRLTGRGLEKDLINIKRRDDIINNPNATDEEVDKALDMVDSSEVFQYIYTAMRLDAEPQASVDDVMREVTLEDLQDGTLQQAIEKLVGTGKKNGMRGFLQKRNQPM